MFQRLAELTTLDLSFNLLSGNLPSSFGNLTSLKSMYLQNNQMTGPIDVLGNLPLTSVSELCISTGRIKHYPCFRNIANNHFTGWIPDRLTSINLQKDGNSFSSSPAPPLLSPLTPTSDPNNGGRNTPPSGDGGDEGADTNTVNNGTGGSKSGIVGGIAGVLVCFVLAGAILILFLLRRRRSKRASSDVEKPDKLSFNQIPTKDVLAIKTAQTSSGSDGRSYEFPAVINLKPPPSERSKSRSFSEDDFSNKPVFTKKL